MTVIPPIQTTHRFVKPFIIVFAIAVAGACALRAIDKEVCMGNPPGAYSLLLNGLSQGLWGTIPTCDIKEKEKP